MVEYELNHLARTAQKRRLDRDGLATANTNDFGRRGSQLVGMMMAGMAAPRCQQGAWLLSKEVDLTTATMA